MLDNAARRMTANALERNSAALTREEYELRHEAAMIDIEQREAKRRKLARNDPIGKLGAAENAFGRHGFACCANRASVSARRAFVSSMRVAPHAIEIIGGLPLGWFAA